MCLLIKHLSRRPAARSQWCRFTYRYFTRLCNGASVQLDESGRIRIDDVEMLPDIQAAVAELWPSVTTENLAQISDIQGYREEFLRLFGFGLPGVDYDSDVPPEMALPSA